MQTIATPHGFGVASAWVQRWSNLVSPGGHVLDVGCGHGRHVRWFAARNHPVIGVDRDPTALASLTDLTSMDAGNPGVQTVLADIENAPWPLISRQVNDPECSQTLQQFDAVIVTNYLWRPLLPTLISSLAPGGVLVYETFAAGNETVGKPGRPDFLLQPGELLTVCAGLRVVAFEDGFIDHPARFVQRIAAVRLEPGSAAQPIRLPIGTG